MWQKQCGYYKQLILILFFYLLFYLPWFSSSTRCIFIYLWHRQTSSLLNYIHIKSSDSKDKKVQPLSFRELIHFMSNKSFFKFFSIFQETYYKQYQQYRANITFHQYSFRPWAYQTYITINYTPHCKSSIQNMLILWSLPSHNYTLIFLFFGNLFDFVIG